MAMQCSWALMLIRMNPLFRGVKSLPARQDDRIASYKFCFGRTYISITMKFINEIVNRGVTILSFFFFFCYLARVSRKIIGARIKD